MEILQTKIRSMAGATSRVIISVILALAPMHIGTPCLASPVRDLKENISNGASTDALQILDKSGVKGGLIVHVGCGDGKLTAALRANDSYLVHGLDTNARNVEKARQYIQSLGLYGKVSVDHWKGGSPVRDTVCLPYIDNLVNLLVSEQPTAVPRDEVFRVLVPNGVAYIKQDGTWTKTVKHYPKEIDEWTHYLHDSTGNAVANDTIVGPPRRMQWVGSPRWARSHEHSASLNALVSANGRIFYIIDEGPRSSIQLPAKFVLAARDAFSGVILWKRPLPEWFNHLFPLKSGPARLTRRLIAVGDEVYTTLGINEPLSAIDAATGKTIRTYDGTKTVEELVASKGILLLVVNPDSTPVDYQQENAHCWAERDRASERWGWDETVDKLMAVEAKTGKTAWQLDTKIVPMSLAADDERVVYHDGEAVVCLELSTGKKLWRTDVPRSPLIPTGWSPSMVMYKDVILFSGQKQSLIALSAEDGSQLWTVKLHPSGHFCPEDVLVVDGLVWSGDIASTSPKSSGVFTGRDPQTGQIKREFSPDINPFAIMHQRCYPSKATAKYIIPSWTGTEFIDPRSQTWQIHHWVRGGCFYGMMPCNGLLYAPPHACACYYQSKLNGFCALAPATESKPEMLTDQQRLEKGPAYTKVRAVKTASSDWPTWRHDALRSGFIQTPMPAELKPAWQTQIGNKGLSLKLSSLVAAEGKLFVASVDEHTVYALDSKTGRKLWSFVAGGRVDSPPTYHEGSVLFGSADGCVYCLCASDGELAWRFHVAPADRRIVAYEQVESLWPLHGSVLVHNGAAYCLAGRSMFLDGGMRLVRLDPKTGKKLSETVLDDRDPSTGENLQSHIDQKKMPVALPDVLSSDGKYIYMRSQQFDLNGNRVTILPESQTIQQGNQHVFSPIGLLDDTWFHRGYWIYGKNAGEGWAEWFQPGRLVPSGRILCVDDDTVYAYGRHPWFLCNSSVLEYRLYAASKTITAATGSRKAGSPVKVEDSPDKKRDGGIPRDITDWKSRSSFPMHMLTEVNFKWVKEQPSVMAYAMVLADKTLFVAGPPDIDDELAGWGKHLDPEVDARHRQQVAALEGKMGGLLWVVSAADGQKLAEYKLDSVPVFDGMIAAGGRLYLSLKDGTILCMGPKQ